MGREPVLCVYIIKVENMRFREIMDDEIKLITLGFTLPVSVNIISPKTARTSFTQFSCVPVILYILSLLSIFYHFSFTQYRNIFKYLVIFVNIIIFNCIHMLFYRTCENAFSQNRPLVANANRRPLF